ncbi:MAG: hypothetical protein J6C82_00990 [Clostridia bacterium]|nr:hypothetical protein [Clostridia bacterium]
MNKILKTVTIAAVMLAVSAQSVFSAALEKISKGTLVSPEENVFRLWGDDNEFILLDVSEDNNSKFFVMAKSYFSKRAYSSGKNQRFDPENPSSVAYFLNGEFLKKGITDSFTKRNYRLPEEIIEHINFNHSWTTEAGRVGGDCPKEYVTKTGIALLSQTEYLKYQDKIGMTDGFDNLIHTPKYTGFWTRTGANSSEMICVRAVTSVTQTLAWAINDAGLNIRPVFWLDIDFFREVPIDLSSAGENVKAIFKEYYTINELEKIYPESWVYDYLGYKPDVSVKNTVIKVDGDSASALKAGAHKMSVNAEFVNNLQEDIGGRIVAVKYHSNGTPQQMASLPLDIPANSSVSAGIELNFNTPCKNGDYVKLFYSSAYDKFAKTSNSVRIY